MTSAKSVFKIDPLKSLDEQTINYVFEVWKYLIIHCKPFDIDYFSDFIKMEKILLFLQVITTLMLTGVIWVVQLVQYPFFSHVEKAGFPLYHRAYTFWVTPIVAPLMIVELLSATLILFYPPEYLDYKLLVGGLILCLIAWLSTFFLQVPLHDRLAAGFDADAHASLVKTNWIRTLVWTARAVLICYFCWKVFRI